MHVAISIHEIQFFVVHQIQFCFKPHHPFKYVCDQTQYYRIPKYNSEQRIHCYLFLPTAAWKKSTAQLFINSFLIVTQLAHFRNYYYIAPLRISWYNPSVPSVSGYFQIMSLRMIWRNWLPANNPLTKIQPCCWRCCLPRVHKLKRRIYNSQPQGMSRAILRFALRFSHSQQSSWIVSETGCRRNWCIHSGRSSCERNYPCVPTRCLRVDQIDRHCTEDCECSSSQTCFHRFAREAGEIKPFCMCFFWCVPRLAGVCAESIHEAWSYVASHGFYWSLAR